MKIRMQNIITTAVILAVPCIAEDKKGAATLEKQDEVAPVVEAISLEQLFTDGIRREGTITVAGPILDLDVKYSPFDNSARKLDLSIGEKGRDLYVVLDNEDEVDFEELEIGDQIAVTGEAVLLGGLTGNIRGDFVNVDFVVLEYSEDESGMQGDDLITVQEYFDEMLRFGSEQVAIRGQILERSATGDQVLFVLGDSGREITAWSDNRTFDISAHESELIAAKVGSTITLYGSFDVEHPMATIFTFKEIW